MFLQSVRVLAVRDVGTHLRDNFLGWVGELKRVVKLLQSVRSPADFFSAALYGRWSSLVGDLFEDKSGVQERILLAYEEGNARLALVERMVPSIERSYVFALHGSASFECMKCMFLFIVWWHDAHRALFGDDPFWNNLFR